MSANGMVVVTGATGNIGRKLAESLLSQGVKVRAVGRSAERLQPLADKGAEAFAGSALDAEAMARAFTGAAAVFLLIPPDYAAPDHRAHQNQVGEAYAAGLRTVGVNRVVNLSSIGADLNAGTGPIKGLHDQEQRLDGLPGLNVVHLRPCFFMENHLHSVGLIKGLGSNGGATRPDLPIGMIATHDIAAAAAELLRAPVFKGRQVRELLGPRDYTMAEATGILGAAIGKPDLKYVQFPYADAEKAMLGMGFSPDSAKAMVEMYRGFNQGFIKAGEPRSAANTTATTLEEFSQTFAAAYGGR